MGAFSVSDRLFGTGNRYNFTAEAFIRTTIVPQIFSFVLLIFLGSILQEPSSDVLLKLSAIFCLVISAVFIQHVAVRVSLRAIAFHMGFISLMLCLAGYALSADPLLSVFLPLGIMIMCLYPLGLDLKHQLVCTLPGWACMVIFCAADGMRGTGSFFDSLYAGFILLSSGILMLVVAFGIRRPVAPEGHADLPEISHIRQHGPGSSARVRKVAVTADDESRVWHEIFEKNLLQDLLKAVIWRLPVFYVLSQLILFYFVFSNAEEKVLFALISLALCIFQMSLHLRLLRLRRFGDILKNCFILACGTAFSTLAAFAVHPEFNFASFLLLGLQILSFALIPWGLRRSLAVLAPVFAGSALVAIESNAPLLIVLLALIVIFAVIRISTAHYQLIVQASAFSFLGRMCSVATPNSMTLGIFVRILELLADSSKIALVYSSGSCRIAGAERDDSKVPEPLAVRALSLKIEEFQREDGLLETNSFEETQKNTLLEMFGFLPDKLIFSNLGIVFDEKEDRLSIIFALPLYSWLFDLHRLYKNLVSIISFLRIYSSSARTQFLSSDVLLSYQRNALDREEELNEVVHMVNNTAQDISIYCEELKEMAAAGGNSETGGDILDRVRRIEGAGRSLSVGVSDLKLIRELALARFAGRTEKIALENFLAETEAYASGAAARKKCTLVFESSLETAGKAILVSSGEFLSTVIRLCLRIVLARTGYKAAVKIVAHEAGGSLCLRIMDTGRAIDPGLRRDLTADIPGPLADLRGEQQLGLVRYFVTLNKGSFSLDPPEEAGFSNQITLTLPLSELSRVSPAQHRHQWILLVDDNDQVTTFYARVAEALELKYFKASSLQEARKIVADHGRPRLVITDVQLADGDGFELLQELLKSYADLPVIVVSGNNDEELIKKIKQAGAIKYLSKPVGRAKLFAEIQAIL